MKKLYSTLFSFLLVLSSSQAQVKTNLIEPGEQVNGYQRPKSVLKDIKKMPAFEVSQILKEDTDERCISGPLVFGKGFDVSYTFDDGNWESVEGGRLWAITIGSDGAYSLNFVFTNFFLPEGANLYIENEQGTVLYGPVTSADLSDDGFFLTDIIAGDCVTITLFEPDNVRTQSSLTIGRVIHGYKNVFGSAKRVAREGLSSPDVVDYPEYEMESDAIGLVLSPSGTKVCTGSLITSADYKFEPYFMTDYRLADDNDDGQITSAEKTWAENCAFLFRNRLDASGNPVTNYTYNTCSFCSGWATSCFLLLRINGNLKQNSNLAWLGWNKNAYLPSGGAVIHHPLDYSNDGYMKISFSDTQFETPGSVKTSCMKTKLSIGTIDRQSCGAPFLEESSKRVVGMFYGRWASLSWIDFTRFSMSWNGGGTSSTRLRDWLDPDGSGVSFTDTNRAMEIIGPSVITGPSTYYVNHLPSGYMVEWHVTDSYYDRFCISQSGNQCTIYPTSDHQLSGASLTAHIKKSGVTVCILSYDISLGSNFASASYNPLSVHVGEGVINISVIPNPDYDGDHQNMDGKRDLNDIITWKLEVSNATTGKKMFSNNIAGAQYSIETSGWESGIYIFRTTIGEDVFVNKILKK